MSVEIQRFDNREHRDQVIGLWTSVFSHKDARNEPSLVIDKKLAVNDGLFFVALEDRSVLGTIMAGYDGHRGWIYTTAVGPGRRNESIGSRLLERAVNELRDLGCVKINLQVYGGDASVTEFYQKNGFEVEDRISMGKEIPENIE